ncbi:Gfo/Idh/MocA family protein [Kitasatospora sp. NPDC008050]|uniref:Gfo/Idh/MocA family protein n=1 Tax=Kitasatospora sp. NPDC008050 TaxID=3364021 RepID=UPI0036E9188B
MSRATGAVSVGIVGFGVAGRQHAEALAGLPEARAGAVLEADPRVDTGPLRRVDSWAQLLATPEIELVALCVPPGGRAELACQALEAGKSVLLETPPAASEREIDRLAEAAARAGRSVGVMVQHRLRVPDPVLALDWSGAAVTATLLVSRFRPPAHYRRGGWRADPAAALGGVGAHLGVHYLDLACQLLGPPRTVGPAARREVAPGIDSRLSAVVEFAGGANLCLTLTSESAARAEHLHVLGTDRTLCVEGGVLRTEIGESDQLWPTRGGTELRAAVYREMVEAIRTGTGPRRCDLESTRAVTRLMAGLRGSADGGPAAVSEP